MNLKILFLLLGVGTLQAAGYSQENHFNLKKNDVSITEILEEIQLQSNYRFFYQKGIFQQTDRMNVELKDASLQQVLEEVLTKRGFSYEIMDRVITVRRILQQKNKERKVSGIVTDQHKQPLPGVTIKIKGTTIGTVTDTDGKFVFRLPDGESVDLVFSFVGMKTVEINYKGEESLNIILEEEIAEMDEVVVTGIFTKARESYTGAVTTITSKELKKFGNRSVISQIRNIDPSFNILENNLTGSDPNQLPDIQMRGSTSMEVGVKDLQTDMGSSSASNLPLFIMDGFEISLQKVMDMDENLIESITLLKDASATAMYGSRGANGVVVITTAKPEPGKIRITYKGSVNIEAPDFTSYNLLNAREKLDYEQVAGIYSYSIPQDEQDLLNLYNERLIEVERGVNTYWLKYPVHTGVGHRHSLRIDGGDDNFRYAANVGYNDVVGVMKKSKRENFTGSMFLQYNFDKVSFQNDLSVTVNKAFNSPYGEFSEYTKLNAYWTPYDEEGKVKKVLEDTYVPNRGSSTIFQYNPLYNATLPTRNTSEYTNIQNNFAIDWTIIPDLTVRGRFTLIKQSGRSDKYLSALHTSFAETDYDRRGTYTYGTDYLFSYEADFTVNYSKVLAEKHQLYAGISYNFAENKTEAHTINAEGYSATNMDFLGMGSAYEKNSKPLSTEGFSRRLGGIANFNYTYDKRYFVDFSGKLEGSSKFGANNRIAPFWSVGFGWNIHNEHFLTNKELVNSLRLRLSYGITGSQDFNPYQAMTTFTYYGKEKYRNWVGSYVLGLGNADLGWQQTGQLNLGIESLLFNGAVRLNVDVYNKLTDDLLSDINLPTATGFNSYKANIGKVRNRGIEVTANVYLWRDTEKEITWSVGGSLAHNKNKIMKISNSLEFLNQELLANADSNPSFLFEEGQSMNTIFAVPSLGIDPSNGKEIFLKKDGSQTYTWDASDEVACGINEPKVWGNFNTMFRYKGLSFNAVFGYRLGGYIYNSTLIDKVENVDPWFNADKRVFYDRWKEPGDVAYFKGVGDRTATKASSRFVMKENTLECRSLNVSYDFNSAWTQKHLSMSYLSVGFYTEDVFRISTIKQERGITYPFARKFSVSLTARF
ncbi:MAG: SusC/RagA family TonB-linked outer membrane protein [Odoribacter splanchnicus]